MPELTHDLLTDATFGVDGGAGAREILTLPDILARLGSGVDLEFTALQAHQMHPWHAFLVQIAALAMHRAGTDRMNQPAEAWRGMLRTLTSEHEEPWSLVVQDLSLPAFMQPAIMEGSLSSWSNRTTSPDEIDVLVTSKNHDVKRRRVAQPQTEHWVYALVSLQTSGGFGGRNNYGVGRMNGGYGTRPCFAMARDPRWPTRFRRDVQVLLQERQGLVDTYGYRPQDGHALLWVLAWDGRTAIDPADCDPFFVEVCRRIRLVPEAGHLAARWTGTETARLNAKDRKGDLGDPWVPIRRADHAAFGYKSLSYRRLQEVLFGTDWSPSVASQAREDDGETPWFVAQVLGRGQGGTEGLHERLIPVPQKARRLLANRDGRARLGALSKERVGLVERLSKEVLWPALRALTEATGSFTRAMDQRVDAIFFPCLFDDVDRPPNDANLTFTGRILEIAREILQEAMESLPLTTARAYYARSKAERIFEGAARRRFPDLYAPAGRERDDRASQ